MKHSTYHRRRAQIRFDETMKFIEDGDQKSRIPQNYNKWRKSKKVKNYWAQREQQEREEYKEGQDNQSSSASINSSIPTSPSSVTRKESIETISLDEAKDLILPRLLPCDTASIKDSLDNITASSFAHFQAHILNSLTSTSLLTLETHLQHLLAMSNILIVGKNKNYPDLDDYFVTLAIKDTRKMLYESLDFRIRKNYLQMIL